MARLFHDACPRPSYTSEHRALARCLILAQSRTSEIQSVASKLSEGGVFVRLLM